MSEYCRPTAANASVAVRLDAGGNRVEADAAIDAPGGIRGFGDDYPAVAAVAGGPACRDTEQVGREAATPVPSVGADPLIPRIGSAADDAEERGELAVG